MGLWRWAVGEVGKDVSPLQQPKQPEDKRPLPPMSRWEDRGVLAPPPLPGEEQEQRMAACLGGEEGPERRALGPGPCSQRARQGEEEKHNSLCRA